MRISLVLALLLGAVVCGVSPAAAKEGAAKLEGTKPNIIVVITDDQGYGPVGAHGHPWIRTPNMDELHSQSTRFTRFLVAPTCSPTRSALMTGRHPMRNGITHTILERERMTLDATTLPQVLAKAGYKSGIFGKWHLGDEDSHQPGNRGFDKVFIHGAGGIGQAYDCSCADAPGNEYFNPVINSNGTFVKTQGYCTNIFFSEALGWIKEQKETDEPFFAYIATNAPHGPFIAPEENEKRFLDLGFSEKQAGFYGMIENIDENLGKLMAKLDAWGLEKDTVLIFMSDNGMTGGGSGRLGKQIGETPSGEKLLPYNAEMKGLKGSPDEGGVRVPFFVRWPGKIEPGQDVDRIAAHIDLYPTLTALAGVAGPEDQVAGRSLLPLVENPKAKWKDRYLFTHCGRWKTGEDPNKYQWQKFAVRNQRYRFVNNNALFDMRKDPGQTKNVIEEHPEVVNKMRAAYDEWWQGTVPMMVNEDAEMSPTRPYHVRYYKQLEASGIPDWTPPEL